MVKRWAIFTYISPQIRKVTNIFINTNVRIVFRIRNTVAKIIRPPRTKTLRPNNIWGINQIKCNTCGRSYVGQTGRSLNVRFQEHIRHIWKNNHQSAYVQHILQNEHEYGQMNSIMTLLKPFNNPNLLIPYEPFLHPNPLIRRQTYSGAIPRRNKPTIANGL